VDDVRNCFVFASNRKFNADVFACEYSDVHVEVLSELRLSEHVAIQEIFVLPFWDIFYKSGVDSFFIFFDDFFEISK
jgi:hypothetical protein